MEPAEENKAQRGTAANSLAALAFIYALLMTLLVMIGTGFFGDQEEQRTLLAWLTLPTLATFISWMAVRTGKQVMRLVVWLAALAALFFCWIAIFSVGLFFLPVPLLLFIAALSPWAHD